MTEQANPQQSAQPRNQCRHVHLEGRRCGSPCLRGENFCYYHHISRRHPKHLGQPPLDAVFTMLPIDDAPSIQLALADILARICTRSLDNKRASLVLYGLSIASINLKRGQHRPELNPKPSEVNAVIEDLEFDPDLGPLAPVALMDVPNDEARKSLMQKFVEYCERPPHACKQCAQRAVIDANKAIGRRLMAELNRRRSLGLPEYDPPLDPNTPYPNDPICAEETARIAAINSAAPPEPAAPSTHQPTGFDGVILSEAHRAESNQPTGFDGVILSGARSAQSKDPETAHTTSTAHTVLPTTVRAGASPLATQNSQLTTPLILPTLYAVAEAPTRKLCRTPTRTRRPKTTPEPTATPDPTETTTTDLTHRTTHLTRAFRHRYHPNEPPTPLQKAKS